jgi:biopolymer transport protein TolQ
MLDLIFGAGLVVQAVLLALIGMSIASWAVIVFKARELGRAEADTESFVEAYLERPFDAVYTDAKEYRASPLAVLFEAGYKDLGQLRRFAASGNAVAPEQVDALVIRLEWIQTDETHRLERGLPFLATTGSSAPFIGLFGTVVGIMDAFRDIGASGSASLAVVAPGIAEALVATAIGLFAAIPAVIGYNYLGARVNRLIERLAAFRGELAQSLRRVGARAA